MTQLERIEQLHPDLVSAFLATGKGDAIPQELQSFLLQLQWAMEIYEYERDVARAARKLRMRVAAEQHAKMEMRTAQARVYEAINFFCTDNNVPVKIWETMYANQFERLAKMCALAGDYKTQGKCYERAETDTALGVTFILSPEITAEEMGFAKRSLKEIAAKHNRGFYLNLIESLPLEKDEKKRLLRDADIEDAEIVQDIDND